MKKKKWIRNSLLVFIIAFALFKSFNFLLLNNSNEIKENIITYNVNFKIDETNNITEMEPKTIFEQLLFNTIKINAINDNTLSSGTGFFYSYISNNKEYLFLVTNKHVVKGFKQGILTFTEKDPEKNIALLGKKIQININDFSNSWFYNEDGQDIAVMPVVPLLNKLNKEMKKEVFFITIPNTICLNKSLEESLDSFENVYFIGYPNSIWDEKNNLPILRSGVTATPVYIDYNGNPSFLIDASVFPGSSGSPVFIINKDLIPQKKGA